MSNSDDVDLVRLFGLSPEEAGGLGLSRAGRSTDSRTKGDPPDESGPERAQPGATDMEHSPDTVTSASARKANRSDELALLAMLEGHPVDEEDPTPASGYDGRDATRGLSLAASIVRYAKHGTKPSNASGGGNIGPDADQDASATQAHGERTAEFKSDVAAEERFVISDRTAADDDDARDLIALFALSDEEAASLGLRPYSEPLSQIVSGSISDDSTRVTTPTPSDVSFPTMHLRAVADADPADFVSPELVVPPTTAAPEPIRHLELDAPSLVDEAVAQVTTEGNVGQAAISELGSAGETRLPLGLARDDEAAVRAPIPLAPISEPTPWIPAYIDSADADVVRGEAASADAVIRPVDFDSPPAIYPLETLEARIDVVDSALLEAFADETTELLDGLHNEVERLESDPADHGALLESRRIIHTIKGGAKLCGFEAVVTLTHACENLLDLLSDGTASLDGPILRCLFDTEPLLRITVQDALSGRDPDERAVAEMVATYDELCAIALSTGGTQSDDGPVEALLASQSIDTQPHEESMMTESAAELPGRLEDSAGGLTSESEREPLAMEASAASGVAAVSPRSGGGRRGTGSINVDLAKVDAVAARFTEMSAQRVSAQQMVSRLVETSSDARRNVTRLHNLVTQIGNECANMRPDEAQDGDLELQSYNVLNTLVLQLQEAVSDQHALVQAIHDAITIHWSQQAAEGRLDADIQNALMSIRLVPIATMRVRLDGVVRQAAEATGKLVRWQFQGGSVAVEKNVFDRLFEPLMHLLRNAVDHGIEPPAVRREAGKPETGALAVNAAQDGNQIVITITDDGGGIVPNKLAALAVERGLITADKANGMTYQEKMGLIFVPGFSTADKLSHMSGRGVGMDAVREACLRMGGSIDVSSRPGIGSIFTMRLPLSLSVTRGLILSDGGCLMAVPVDQVTALHLVAAGDVVATPEGRLARLEGVELPIYNLPPLPGARLTGYLQNGEVNVLQVPHGSGSIGLLIEDVLGEEEISIKVPPPLLRGVKTLLGAYVMPDGRVAPVINLPQLLIDLRPVVTLAPPRIEDHGDDLIALVVDDSMSMRVALSGTLQSAGFKVLTARDGQEALDVMKREGLPSIITLDVEMPRMDGLETLFAIRQIPDAQELPVFMLTSRGGAKHRRAAEQLGATRYFTKPYRDSELATAALEACAAAISA